ncbi:hypothetical protein PhCBS80983_g02402 [Powellomyces hirtus]|uniref:Uncharacterized protein n=1 Tax=Powellomyces hirtus TaxID=109895 RepID=A0A507E8R2_9FUNG|nr:hypothetical protein PhCBS80983_g02402 [Powellomyces hirtus]
MPRKDFRNDLAQLREMAATLESQRIYALQLGDVDGEVVFQFSYDELYWLRVSVQLEDLHLYPHGSTGFAFLGDGNTDHRANGAAEVLQRVNVAKQSLSDAISSVSRNLCAYFGIPWAPEARIISSLSALPPPEPMYVSSVQDDVTSDVTSEVEVVESDEEFSDDPAFDELSKAAHIQPAMRSLLLQDVRQLKSCGYHDVGYLTLPTEKGFILYMSIHVQRLVNSELLTLDQCGAWNLEVDSYLVLLMRFEPSYVNVMKQNGRRYVKGMIGDPDMAFHERPQVEFRVTTSDSPSVSASEAFISYRKSTANKPVYRNHPEMEPTNKHALTTFLLSWTLGDLLNNRFIVILANRLHFDSSWSAAESFYEQQQLNPQATFEKRNIISPTDIHHTPAQRNRLASIDSAKKSASNDLDSLMLSDDLDSLEAPGQVWENYLNFSLLAVIHQTHVVDLLVSLAYTAAINSQLDPFPHGIGYEETSQFDSGTAYAVSASPDALHLLPEDYKIYKDDIIELSQHGVLYRYKVTGVSSNMVNVNSQGPTMPENVWKALRTEFRVFRTEWIGWSRQENPLSGCSLIVTTLEKLPAIRDLRIALEKQLPSINRIIETDEDEEDAGPEQKRKTKAELEKIEREKGEKRARDEHDQKILERQTTLSLRPILDKIDPLIYPLLRWIICSNRSFIKELRRPEEKVANVGAGQLQMIMSNPEKEELFVKNQRQWAGNTDHALDCATSTGYAVLGGNPWPHSKIGVVQCMSLNEIVNHPAQFVSVQPYLVVANIDWVQTRYLLVVQKFSESKSQLQNAATPEFAGVAYLPMDLSYYPVSFANTPIKIPQGRIAVSHIWDLVAKEKFIDPGLASLEREEQEERERSCLSTGSGKRFRSGEVIDLTETSPFPKRFIAKLKSKLGGLA